MLKSCRTSPTKPATPHLPLSSAIRLLRGKIRLRLFENSRVHKEPFFVVAQNLPPDSKRISGGTSRVSFSYAKRSRQSGIPSCAAFRRSFQWTGKFERGGVYNEAKARSHRSRRTSQESSSSPSRQSSRIASTHGRTRRNIKGKGPDGMVKSQGHCS